MVAVRDSALFMKIFPGVKIIPIVKQLGFFRLQIGNNDTLLKKTSVQYVLTWMWINIKVTGAGKSGAQQSRA